MQAVSRLNDTFTIGALVLVVGAGLYNVVFGHYNVLYTVAPDPRDCYIYARCHADESGSP